MSLSPSQDAIRVLGETPQRAYFSRQNNLAFHDLTPGKIMPSLAKQVLGLSFKFVPAPRLTTSHKTIHDTMDRLNRDVDLKVFFAGVPEDPDSQKEYHPKLYTKSEWIPPSKCIPRTTTTRLHNFHQALLRIFYQRRGKANLSSSQWKLLNTLRRDANILIVSADKGLGPCAVTYSQYISDALKHLLDESTYQRLSKEEAFEEASETGRLIRHWCDKHQDCIPSTFTEFIRNKLSSALEDPFGYFYLMYKIHKNPTSTRPVCSDCSSLINPLGKLVDILLQPVAQGQPSYFKNSFELKQILEKMNISGKISLFTCDAYSMYTCIPTHIALPLIKQYLVKHGQDFGLTMPVILALCDALDIVMPRNLIRFGDCYFKQISGTAMGICPAPPWAIIYFAIHENAILPRWRHHVPFWKRYIDDGFGLWRHHPNPAEDKRLWEAFKADVDNFDGLRWDFVGPTTSINFMDITMTVESGKLTFTMYEKDLNLYLYIPPTSAHPPGNITGLIFGNILRIFQLCSCPNDIKTRMRVFFRRLRNCNYPPEVLIPLFEKAVENAKTYLRRTPAEHAWRKQLTADSSKRRVFLHLPYHPNDPTSKEIQRLWRHHVMTPPGDTPLNELVNFRGSKLPVDRLTIAYSRAPNLGNLFSVRKIHKHKGLPVSSFID